MHSVKSLLWHECAAIFEHLILCKHTHGSKSQDAGTKSQVKVKVWFWYLWMLLSNKSITTCGDDANKPCGSAVAKMPFGHVAMHSGPTCCVALIQKLQLEASHTVCQEQLNTIRTNKVQHDSEAANQAWQPARWIQEKASSKHALRARTPNKPSCWRSYSVSTVRTARNAWMKTSMAATSVPVFEQVKLDVSQRVSFPIGRLSTYINFLVTSWTVQPPSALVGLRGSDGCDSEWKGKQRDWREEIFVTLLSPKGTK